MRELQAVLFDLDDTLHDDTLAFTSAADDVAREVAAEHGVDALALKAAYVAEAEGFWKRLTAEQVQELLVSKLSSLRSRLWGTALNSVGLHDPQLAERSATNYNLYRTKYFALFPGALDLLKRLRTAGMKLGLVTNGVSETHREKIALLQVSEYFDAIFLADEVGMVKPDPRLFAHACEKLGARAAATAMVGDRYERDIAGAIEAGLYTVWMNLRGEPLPEGAAAPDATVGTIAEVGSVLLPEEPGVRSGKIGEQLGNARKALKMALQTPTDTPFGLKPNIAAGLAYLFGIVGGIIIMLGGGTNRMVKFAAAQSITMWGLYIVLTVALSFLGYMASFIGMLTWLIEIVWFILWLWTFISGFQGKEVEVPVIAGITRSLFKSAA